ncbi:MAG TPA: hypothetical protein VMF89_32990, partial [Polyangiales bacterium]|nr:hypothetical protein [Polyangiales bacterium]
GGKCPAGTPSTVKASLNARASQWEQSASGTDEFCVPDPTVTSCAGLNNFGNDCSAKEEAAGACGEQITEQAASGVCVGPSGSQVCSYICKTNADCAAGSCVGVSPRYCDPF